MAKQLVDENKAYYCFLTEQELKERKEKAIKEGLPPFAYHNHYRTLDPKACKKRLERGDSSVIRFKNPEKPYQFKDLIRGEVKFPKDMIGDFIIMRSNGLPVYNFCCVVDDWKMQINYVIRAEEHLNNTLRQLMLYESFGTPPPQFAHCSLLVGGDHQKLSKRHGSTSVSQYRKAGYLPNALMNGLGLLGWTHPEEKEILTIEEMISRFQVKQLNKAPAMCDPKKMAFINGQHVQKLSPEELLLYANPFISCKSFHSLSENQKQSCLLAFINKVQLPGDFNQHLAILFETPSPSEEVREINSWESTPLIREYLKGELELLLNQGQDYPTEKNFQQWTETHQKEHENQGETSL